MNFPKNDNKYNFQMLIYKKQMDFILTYGLLIKQKLRKLIIRTDTLLLLFQKARIVAR